MKIKKIIILIVLLLFVSALVTLVVSCGKTSQPVNKSLYIIFNANGGEFLPGQPTYSVSVQQGDSIVLPEVLPTRDGYVFIDWYLSEELKDSDKLNIALFKAVEGRTIFAKWESVDTYKHSISVSSFENAKINVFTNPRSIYPEIVNRASKGTILILDIEITNPAYMLEKGSLKAVDILSTNQDIIIDENTLMFEMPSYPITILARFEKRPFNIDIVGKENLNGMVIIGSETAKQGEDVTVFAIPNIGFKLDEIKILGNGEIVSNNVFTMGAYDTALSVKFSRVDKYISYPIVINQVEGAMIKCNEVIANAGDFIALDIDLSEGYYLNSLLLNGLPVEKNGFVMPESEAIVTAIIYEIDLSEKFNLSLAVKPENLSNQYISIKNFKSEGYSAGEKIELDTNSLGEFIIDSIAVNGKYCSLNTLFMPMENAVLTVSLSTKGNIIKISQNNTLQIAVSHEYANVGEMVKIDILEPLDGKILNLEYRKEPDGDVYYQILDNQFEMPDFPIIITAISASLGSEERTISIQAAINGYIEVENANFGYGFNEVVTTKIYPELGSCISKLFYVNSEKEMTEENIFYVFKTKDVKVGLDSISFTMPNFNIKLYAEFKKYHSINPFENEKLIIYPERELAFEGDDIYVYAFARNNYDLSAFTITQNNVEIDISMYFTMGNIDVELNYFNKTSANQIQYDIIINSFENGKIEGPSRAKVGSLVPLNILPAKGYSLYSLKIKKSSDLDSVATEIVDTFIMPNYKVSILAQFRYIEGTNSFSLSKAYQEKKSNYFNDFGIYLRYFDNLTSISTLFNASPQILNISAYIEAVLLGETNWGTSFYIIETNRPTMLNSLGQVFSNYFKNDIGEIIDCELFNGYITISVGGVAEEDYLLVKNGLHLCDGRYYVFEKLDGTYGIYRSLINYPFEIIPSYFKETGKIPRIISYLGKNTYPNGNGIKGIYLANIRTLADFSLSNLSLVEELDLTQITRIGIGVFRGSRSLNKVYIGSENNKYIVDAGAIYTKNKQTLILYPSGRIDSTFTIAFGVVNINDYAFYEAINLSNIYFQSNKKINSIGDSAFWGCSSLSNIQVVAMNPETTATADLNNILSDGSRIGDYSFANTKGIRRYNISCVDRVGNSAFEWDGSLELTIDISLKENNCILSYLEPIYIKGEEPYVNLKIILHPIMLNDYLNNNIWNIYEFAFVVD